MQRLEKAERRKEIGFPMIEEAPLSNESVGRQQNQGAIDRRARQT
jgi:hypothetical protein